MRKAAKILLIVAILLWAVAAFALLMTGWVSALSPQDIPMSRSLIRPAVSG